MTGPGRGSRGTFRRAEGRKKKKKRMKGVSERSAGEIGDWRLP